ncbi:MAG TPA: cytochrome c biogenesis protein CcdA [Beutenbergiaceae bacterium]|nr:cytochrome c biogenesis protein CcdA [Beutenbergiaceae bacterium]
MSWLQELGSVFAETVISGSVLAALPVALLAGVISFASPCVLPLVPGYVGYVSGMAGATGLKKSGGSGEAGGGPRVRLVLGVLLFIAGFTAVFVAMTIALSTAGMWLFRWQDTITRILGVVVIVMGLAFIGKVPFLQRQRRLPVSPRAGLAGAPVLGVVFGLGWTPCIGPTLAAVLALAQSAAEPGRALSLVVAYCLGLGLPFLAVAAGLKSSQRMLTFMRRHRVGIMRFGGVVLVLIGLALVTGVWAMFTQWLQGHIANFDLVI